MSQGLRDKLSPGATSVAVQTSPPSEAEAVHSTPRPSPTAPARTKPPPRGEATNAVEDLRARIDLLSDAIDGIKKERRSMQETLDTRKKPTETESSPPSANPPSVPVDVGAPPTQCPPPQDQLLPQPYSPRPPPNEPQPDFQHILRVEHECIK